MALNPTVTVIMKPPAAMTVLEALKAESYTIKTGFVCRSQDDIICVNGICNDRDKAWMIEVNGQYETVNSQSVVYPTDLVVLKYASLKEK